MNKLIRIVMIAAAVGASGLAHATFIGIVANPGGVLMPVAGDNSYAVRDRGAFSSNHSKVHNTASSAPGKAFSDFYLAGPGKLDFRFSSVTPVGAADDHEDMLGMMKAFSIPVPEPGTLALFGIGLAGLICARKNPLTQKSTVEG